MGHNAMQGKGGEGGGLKRHTNMYNDGGEGVGYQKGLPICITQGAGGGGRGGY